MLKNILTNVIQTTEYDIIIVPSSFIGMRKMRVQTDEEDTEASITVLGDIFEYLLEDIEDVPLLLVQSEKVNLELLWKSICVLFSSSSQISLLFQKALKFSLKKADIHCFLNIEPSFHEEKSEDEFTEYVKKSKEEIERFERANSEVFKEASRYVEFHYLTTQKIELLKDELATCGKDVGILIIYMPSKHYRLYGLFTELLEDSEISFPILIARRKISIVKEEKEKEVEEEKTSPKKIEDKIIEDEKEEEETISIDDTIKETIKEEVKKDILGKSETEEEKEKKKEVEDSKEEKKEKEVKEMGEPDKKDEEEMSEIEELKEEVKEEVIEEIKKEVKKEIKSEPKKEVKKEVTKELKKEENLEELKETIIDEIKEEIKEEIKYELRKDLKEPKKELKEKVIEEIKVKEEEEEEEEDLEEEESEEEEDEEVTSRMEFE
jgi:hypothetical protein